MALDADDLPQVGHVEQAVDVLRPWTNFERRTFTRPRLKSLIQKG